MITLCECIHCGSTDQRAHLAIRGGICGHCWIVLDAATRAGDMTTMWWTDGEGAGWESSPISDIWRPAKSGWEPSKATDALLSEMMTIRDRVCPDATLTIGPALMSGVAGHTEIEGIAPTDPACIYVALSAPAHPISTLRHELMHAVWGRLDVGETETLERWGNSLRGIACGYPAEWWGRSGEAEAEAYADFYAPTNGRSRRLPEPPPDAVAVLHLIEAGHVGRRQE